MLEVQTASDHFRSHGILVHKRVQPLVDILSTLPGVSINYMTTDTDDNDTEFYVDFSLEERKAGWHALERIMGAVQFMQYVHDENVQLVTWLDDGLRWHLHGYDEADAGFLAGAIAEGYSSDDIVDDEEEGDQLCDDCKAELEEERKNSTIN